MKLRTSTTHKNEGKQTKKNLRPSFTLSVLLFAPTNTDIINRISSYLSPPPPVQHNVSHTSLSKAWLVNWHRLWYHTVIELENDPSYNCCGTPRLPSSWSMPAAASSVFDNGIRSNQRQNITTNKNICWRYKSILGVSQQSWLCPASYMTWFYYFFCRESELWAITDQSLNCSVSP